MVRKGQAKASYMDESDSDSDFIPEARPPAKKKAKAARTSTQDPMPTADTAGRGRGAEARFQAELQRALRASCSDGVEGEDAGSDRELGMEEGSCSKMNKDSKKTRVVPEEEPQNKDEAGLVGEQGTIVEDSQEEVKHGINSADTIVLDDDDEDEPVGRKRNARVIESDEDELNKETEVAKNYTVDDEPKNVQQTKKVDEVEVVGDRRRRESGDSLDSDRRTRKKPKRYAESSDSDDDGEALMEGGESEEELELAKKKKAKVMKSPAKKAALNIKTKAAKKSEEKPAAKAKPPAKPRFSSRPPQTAVAPAAASPVRPLGSHNPAASPSAPPAPRPLPARAPAWRPPGRVGTAPSPLPASPGLTPGLRRLGLSRNFRSPAPLHKLGKLN